VLSAIGGVGMWSVIVALPAVQAEFGVARSAASLPYTMTMICFGFGGILMGRLSDRVGIFIPVVGGAVCLGLGYAVASQATSLWQFTLAQGLLVGVASSVMEPAEPRHRRRLAAATRDIFRARARRRLSRVALQEVQK
jgi:MFS family permease